MTTEATVQRLGDDALLVALPDLAAVRALDDVVRAARGRGDRAFAAVVDQVPAAQTLLVRAAPRADLDDLARALAELTGPGPAAPPADPGHLVELPVRYDGPDLAEVAELTGLDVDEVVRRHLAPEYTAAFGGFMPGFVYLVGLDPVLRVPRRSSPRERLPAGAVGLADRFTAVYPAATPGGWRLLGTCDVPLFDVHRDPPALLAPGARVRFVRAPRARVVAPRAAGDRGAPARVRDGARPATSDPATRDPATSDPATRDPAAPSPERGDGPATRDPALVVVDPGILTLVEDLGRPGWAHVGVGRAGAADPEALRLANRLVGNPEGAAGLEVLLGGLRLRAQVPVTIALAGALGSADVDGRPVGRHAPIELRADEVLHLATAARGLRVYVAVRGGLEVEQVLGSRSADRLAGFGPAPLARGDTLAVGPAPVDPPPVDVAPVRDWPSAAVLRAVPGPQADWFVDARAALVDPAGWLVTPATDRVALRLDGVPLRRTPRRATAEVAPAGLVPGAVQVPPDGRPIVFGVDHPVTGGYPVVAVVRSADLHWLAQLRPGERTRFTLP